MHVRAIMLHGTLGIMFAITVTTRASLMPNVTGVHFVPFGSLMNSRQREVFATGLNCRIVWSGIRSASWRRHILAERQPSLEHRVNIGRLMV